MQLQDQNLRNLFEKPFFPLSEDIVEAVAQGLVIKLPKSYKKFLVEVNGGIPKNSGFRFKDDSNGSLLSGFYGIVPDRYYNLLFYCGVYSSRVPSNTLPIAGDQLGNIILLSVKGQDYGKVYFWDHEREADEGETPDYSNLSLVADSFEEFLEKLEPDDA